MNRHRLLLLVACGLCVGACDQDDPEARAIRGASDTLQSLLPEADQAPEILFVSGTAPDSPGDVEYRKARLEGVVQSLAGATRTGSPSEKASASVLSSNAHLALAKTEGVAAADAIRELMSEAMQGRVALGAWLNLQGTVAALSTYDPGPELAAIDAQVATLAGEVEARRNRRKEVESRVGSLRAAAAAEADKARTERQAELLLREQARGLSETEALVLIEQATGHRRTADAFDARASDLEAQGDAIAPELGEIDLDLERLNNQRNALEKGRQEVSVRTQRIEKQIAEAKAEATTSQTEIEQAVARMGSTADGSLKTAFEATQARIDQAISAAAAGSRDARVPAALALGAAKQALGDLEWFRAQAAEVHAGFLRDLASAEPTLANRSAYAAARDRLHNERTDALERATTAYTEAHEAFGSVPSRGDSTTQARLGEKLRDIVRITSDGRVDLLVPESEPAPEEFVEPEGVPAGGDEGEIAGVVDALSDALSRGDAEGARAFFHASTPAANSLLDAMMPVSLATARLDRVCDDAFGRTFSAYVADQGAPAGMGGGVGSGMKGSDLSISVSGDTASASAPNAGQTLDFVRVDGSWKVSLDAMVQSNPALSMAAPMMGLIAGAMNDVAERVENGKFANLEEVMQALAASMGGGLGGPGGGGGGGG